MSFAATTNDKSSIVRPPRGELEFRVLTGPDAGQIVRVDSPKCSIGSAPQCTYRVGGDRSESLHCLIVRGEQAAICRRFGTNTRLNGKPFEHAILNLGDQLTIGSLELELISGVPMASALQGLPWIAAIPRRLKSASESRRDPSTEHDRPESRLEPATAPEATRQSRARARKLLGALREMKRQMRMQGDRLRTAQEQLQEFELQQKAASQSVSAEVDALRKQNAQLEHDCGQLRAEVDLWTGERLELTGRLRELEIETEKFQQDLQQREQEPAANLKPLDENDARYDVQLERVKRELVESREAYERARNQIQEYQQSLLQAQQEANQAHQQVCEAAQQADQVAAERAELLNQIEELRQATAVADQVEVTDRELRRLQTQLGALQAELATEREQITELKECHEKELQDRASRSEAELSALHRAA